MAKPASPGLHSAGRMLESNLWSGTVPFWLGLMIDDNDVPGADVQDLMVFPASYGTFDDKERGALAVFE